MKKNVEIRINAPILSNPDAIKNACISALSHVGEAIVQDVSRAKANVFADSEGKWSFPGGGYTDAEGYYSSGMVPYWRGELLGSFQMKGAVDRLTFELEFTAPYAELIEKGGQSVQPPPMTWQLDKQLTGKIKNRLEVRAHPYVGSVAFKISEHLEDFGYLDIFSIAFIDAIK